MPSKNRTYDRLKATRAFRRSRRRMARLNRRWRCKQGGVFMRRIMLPIFVLLGMACAPVSHYVKDGPRASFRVSSMTHVMQRSPLAVPGPETIRMVTVTNPTHDDVVFVCDDDFRTIVPPNTETVFRLDERDVHCDLQNDITYSPNTGVQ
jgi:hypothetical protein